jgi:hypothetical protein
VTDAAGTDEDGGGEPAGGVNAAETPETGDKPARTRRRRRGGRGRRRSDTAPVGSGSDDGAADE